MTAVDAGTATRTGTEPASGDPVLPPPRGDLSSAVIARLRGRPGALPGPGAVKAAGPYGEDVHLALHVAYELHYRGFAGVSDAMEWDVDLLRLRALLEAHFEEALRAACGRLPAPAEVLETLLTEPVDGRGTSHYLVRHGTMEQLKEHAILRSVHQLREADPHVWVLPRLRGRAKAGMMTVQYEEYGCGRAERIHSHLYAELMRALDLNPAYGHYLPQIGAPALAAANLMSLLALHRAHRAALVGHFAVLEITSSPAASRIAAALRRAGAGDAATAFYDEHVEADAVHEQLVRHEVVAPLLAEEPHLATDLAFGAVATLLLEDRFADAATQAWQSGRSALRPDERRSG